MKTSTTALLAALFCIAGSACGDDADPIVELTVLETIPVTFDAMEGGVAESAQVDLDDLRNEPRYADVVAQLVCGALDASASFIKVESLDVGAGATVVDYNVEVATRGSDNFVQLFRFNGSIVEGDRIGLDTSRITLSADGLSRIAQTILSTTPSLSVRVTATVPAALDDLQIAVSLALDFSSQKNSCPSTTTGL